MTKVSACVGCGTTVIGERPRCPACHDLHATAMTDDVITSPRTRLDVEVAPPIDIEMTTPRARRVTRGLLPSFLVAWFVGFEVVVIVALAMGILVKGCDP